MVEQKDNSKRIAEIHQELFTLNRKKDIIFYQTQKDIYENTLHYEQYEYNDRPKIKESDFHLELLKNEEYQKILEDINRLEEERLELGDDLFGNDDPF